MRGRAFEGLAHDVEVGGRKPAFAGPFEEGLAVKCGRRDVCAWFTNDVTPDITDGPSGWIGDLEGASQVGAPGGIFAGVANFIRVEGGEMGGRNAVERAPHLVAGRRKEISHTALPFVVGEGEGQAMFRQTDG